jgi:hypothetical protein
MPIRRSINAYRAATPFEQAGWTLAFVAAAVTVPSLLRWMLASIAEAGRAEAGFAAVAARMAVHATGQLVQWIGMGVLAGLAVLCAFSAAAALRSRGGGIPAWAVAETYVIGTAIALGGLAWLA